jgi:hypothetical protein
MSARRISVLLDDGAFATLSFEAKRRNVGLAEIIREAVDARVAELRSGRRPTVGVARSSDGRSAAEVTAEPIAESPS